MLKTQIRDTMPTDLAPRLPLDPVASSRQRGIVVQIGTRQLRTTPVFDAYWEFAAERQRIFFRRLEGVSGAVTTDLVLKLFKFTNERTGWPRENPFTRPRTLCLQEAASSDTSLSIETTFG